METNLQNRESANKAGSQNQVLDFCNQIPNKLKVLLGSFDLKKPQDIFDFLQPKISNLENPYKILNLEKASERLWQAWLKQESILIYGDYDLDGTSGIALLYTSFQALGFKNLNYFQPSKANDGYGLHASVLEKYKLDHEITLVVTVDVGITGTVACIRARELKIDVIITDHHLAQDELPDAFAIVNPNQPDDRSGLGYLCGCGVGFYLVRGLCKKFVENGSQVAFDLKSVLPFFAIATVTDMVPIVKDNRTLLKFAFESFRSVSNLGLKALMEELKISGRKLDAADIGLTLAPKINAISRMSATIKPIDLLFQDTEVGAKMFAKDILKLNVERKQLQEKGLQEVKTAFTDQQLNKPTDLANPYRVFFYSSPNIHHGVTGLIASKMVEQFGGSFFIGAQSLETGVVVGSSRKSDKVTYSLVDAMAVSKAYWIRFGGHASAAGFEYLKDNQNLLADNAQSYLDQLVPTDGTLENGNTGAGLGGSDLIDLDWFDLNTHFFSWVQFLEPYGKQFPEPVFRLKNVPVFSVKKMKEIHFKLNVVNPHNREPLNFVLFNSNSQQQKMLTSLNREFDICFKIKKDNFNYDQRFQFIIERISSVSI